MFTFFFLCYSPAVDDKSHKPVSGSFLGKDNGDYLWVNVIRLWFYRTYWLYFCLVFRGLKLSSFFCLVRQGLLSSSGWLLIHNPTSELKCWHYSCVLLPWALILHTYFFDTVPEKKWPFKNFLPFSLLNKGLDIACSFLLLKRNMISLIVLAGVSHPTANSYL